MQEIIITLLILGAGYYFLTRSKEEIKEEKPITHSQSIQTEPIINQAEKEEQKALEKTIDELIKNIKQFNHTLK
jgi:hypothetical protein